ncbi:hypothetical protein BDR26DRAFT_864741 [Obelidium mucronatum]|nr:hypothetical protein BDR26DRAFT_864741 [Obelidium mucronatum]
MVVARRRFRKLKHAVGRIKTGYKLRHQRLLREKLEKLAQIKAQKQLLLEKKRMAEEISSSQSTEDKDASTFTSGSDFDGASQESNVAPQELVPPSPIPVSQLSSAHLSLLAPLPTAAQLTSDAPTLEDPMVKDPASTECDEPSSSQTLAQNSVIKPSKLVSLLPQRRTARKLVAPTPITSTISTVSVGKRSAPSKAHASSSAPLRPSSTLAANVRTVFCHLDNLTAKEVERLTASNTSKNCGHLAVTLRIEVVKMGIIRPPSPGLETTRQDSINNIEDPHCGVDATRKTRIQWCANLLQESSSPSSPPLPPPPAPAPRKENEEEQQDSQKHLSLLQERQKHQQPLSNESSKTPNTPSCLRKNMQVLKVMDIKNEVVVVKRLKYLDDEGSGSGYGGAEDDELMMGDGEMEELCLAAAEKVASGIGGGGGKSRRVSVSKRIASASSIGAGKGGAKKKSKIAINSGDGVGGAKKVLKGDVTSSSSVAKAPASRIAIGSGAVRK